VIESRDAETIYDVPLMMLKESLDVTVMLKLRLKDRKEPDLRKWKAFLGKLKNPLHEVRIGLVGKYNELQDAYKSIYEAFIHAGAINECKVIVEPVHSESLEGGEKEVNLPMERLKSASDIVTVMSLMINIGNNSRRQIYSLRDIIQRPTW